MVSTCTVCHAVVTAFRTADSRESGLGRILTERCIQRPCSSLPHDLPDAHGKPPQNLVCVARKVGLNGT